MKFGDEFFKKVEKKTNVSKDTILNLAEKLQKGNMKDEKTLSEVIDTLSKMTGKKVSEEQKSKIIKKVVEDKVPNNVEKMSNVCWAFFFLVAISISQFNSIF